MYKVLHISPHLGGGVGTVLRAYLKEDKKNIHKIFCLDSINDFSKEILKSNNIFFKESMHNHYNKLLDEIRNNDIIVIHWWNHPLLFELLVKYPLPPSRIIFWSHISGFSAPQIFSHKLFEYGDKFIFSTPISFLTKEVKKYSNKNKLSYIWSTAGVNHLKEIKKKKHNFFNIGYIGTLDFSKIHKDFIKICSKINIPNIRFIVCGEGCDKEKLIQQSKELNIYDKFIFTGFVEDIKPYLEIIDIFVYPLNRNHYGTCDQVLTEAMSVGITPVVFNNKMESYMVHHSYNGIVTHNKKEYIEGIYNLYKNSAYKKIMESNARKSAIGRYCINKLCLDWETLYNEIIDTPKTSKKWLGKYLGEEVKPHQIFLESIGDYSKLFLKKKKRNNILSNNNWQSKTKGTPIHYSSFFKDKIFNKWINI